MDKEKVFDAIVELLEYVATLTDWEWDNMAVPALKALKSTILGLFGNEDMVAAGAVLPIEVQEKIQEIGGRVRAECDGAA